MKIRVNERQYNLLKSIKENSNGKTYIANFELIFGAATEEEAVAQLEAMKQQIVEATKNGEVFPSLYEKVPFGSQPKRIK